MNALNTRVSGRVRYEAASATAGTVKARFHSCSSSHASLTHTRGTCLQGTVYVKNRQELGPHTAVNAKLELHARGVVGASMKPVSSRDVQARIELSHKMLNITGTPAARLPRVSAEALTHALATFARPSLTTLCCAADSQDCRLRVGVDVMTRSCYAELRENHLSIKVGSGGTWNVLYDL